jgi:phospholipase C
VGKHYDQRRFVRASLFIVGVLTLAAAATATAASTGPPAAARPIRHVVVIYLENHSFDNVLGYWCDDHPGRCPDGGMPATVTLSNGAIVRPHIMPDTVPSVNHNVPSQLAVMNIVGGVPRMNGWQNIPDGSCSAATSPPYQCIGGYLPSQIPNLAALAQDFTISDKTFSMADSPSWGGHMYAVASGLDGFQGNNPVPAPKVTPGPGWGCDSNKITGWISPQGNTSFVPSCVPDPSLGLRNGGAFEPTPVKYLPTIMDRLDAAGLTWQLYGAQYGQPGYIWSICPTFAECLHSRQDANLVPDSQFMHEAKAGMLPSFSVVTPGGSDFMNSCHNGTSMTACDNWVGSLVGAVENGRDWGSTTIFITWDDCGCFYDQVRPPVNPDGTQEGPRVPLIIVSPYTKLGYTDTTAATFASILAYAEHTFGLAPLGLNDARAYPFTKAFNYAQPPRRPVPMVTRPLPPSARHLRLTPAQLNDPT